MYIIKHKLSDKYFFFLSILICFAPRLFAQSASDTLKLEGRILDYNQIYLPSATVMLMSNDTLLLKTTIANDVGYFSFSKLKKDKYSIKVSLVGYVQDSILWISANAADSNRNKNIVIRLRASQNILKEVVIKGKNRPLVERKLDKLIFNVENSGLNIGNSAFDILQRSPGVSIDENGVVSLNGQQGVTILINDKPTYLSQSQLTTFLKSLRGEDLSKIEIIANPSSKYDAAGTAILNIKTKVNNKMGVNGNLYATHSQSKYASDYAGITLNYKNNHINTSIGYNGGIENYWNTNESVSGFSNSNTILRNSSGGDYRSYRNNLQTNLTYELNDNHSIALSTTHLLNTYKTLNFQGRNDFYSSVGTIDSTSTTTTTGASKFNSNQYSLFYYGNLDTLGSKILVGLDYSLFKSPLDLDLATEFLSNVNPTTRQKLINNYNSVNTDIKAFKADYTKVFRNSAQLEFGIKASQVKLLELKASMRRTGP